MIGWGGLFILACAPAAIFPPEVLEKVDRAVSFKQVVDHPAEYQGRVVEFGGQILGSLVEGDEVQLLVRELPIQTKPVYGPVDRGGARGMFIIRFTGKVGEQDLQHGNMVIVIGPMMGNVVTNVTGCPSADPRSARNASTSGGHKENQSRIIPIRRTPRGMCRSFNKPTASTNQTQS